MFPKLKCQYPEDAEGRLIRHKLSDEDLTAYEGVLGHFHVQRNKVDPGPAMDWDQVIHGARTLIQPPPSPRLSAGKGW